MLYALQGVPQLRAPACVVRLDLLWRPAGAGTHIENPTGRELPGFLDAKEAPPDLQTSRDLGTQDFRRTDPPPLLRVAITQAITRAEVQE